MNPKSKSTEPAKAPGTVTATARGPETPFDPPSAAAVIELPECDPDRYELLGEVGAGGLGLVRKVYDHRLDRAVALKELQEHSYNADARFVREAKLSARLEHPGVVPVHDVGRWPNGEPFYCMKLVSGRSLKETIASCETFSQRLALLSNLQVVAEAIAFAHSRRIIHRDLKPSNIIVGEYGETVVIDWGLAKDLTDESGEHELDVGPYRATGAQGLTVAGTVLGTPAYMSPEQARGEPVDEATDIYALGAILYQVLAGVAPYAGDDSDAVLRGVLEGPPAPVDQVQPGVAPDLAAIVAKAMARDRAERYTSAKQFADDLRRFQTGQLVGAHQYTTWEMARRWVARRKAVVTVATAMAVALVAVGVVSFRRVVAERDRAETSQKRAERGEREARQSRDDLLLANARSTLLSDPTASLAWLKQYPVDGADYAEAQRIALEAIERGVAHHVLHQAEGEIFVHAAFSADGRYVVFGGQPGGMKRWDMREQKLEHIPSSAAYHFDFEFVAGSSSKLVATGDGAIVLYDFDQRTARELGRHTPLAYSSVSPDATRLAVAASPGTMAIWDLSSEQQGTVRIPDGRVIATLFVGPELVAVTYDEPRAPVVLVDLGTGRQTTLAGHTLPVRDVVSLGDGQIATGSDDTTIRIWQASAGKLVRVLEAHTRGVTELDVSPDGRLLASVGEDATVRVWDLATGTHRSFVQRGGPAAVRFFPDSTRVAAVDFAGGAHIWALDGGAHQELLGHRDEVAALAIAPDGQHIVTGAIKGGLRIWQVETRGRHALRGHTLAVRDIDVRPDGSAIAVSSRDGSVRLWTPEGDLLGDADFGEMMWRVYPMRGGDVIGFGKSTIKRWRPGVGVQELMPDQGWMAHLAASENVLAAVERAAPGRIRVWRPADERWTDLGQTRDGARNVRVPPAGDYVIVVTRDNVVQSWNVNTGRMTELAVHPGGVRTMGVAADGDLAATAGEDDRVVVCHLATGDCDEYQMAKAVRRITFAPNSKFLAAGDETGDIFVLALDSAEITRLGTIGGFVNQIAVTDDSRYLAAVTPRSTEIAVWDLVDKHRYSMRGHSEGVTSVVAIPNSTKLASGGTDLAVRLWDLSTLPKPPTYPAEFSDWLGIYTTFQNKQEKP